MTKTDIINEKIRAAKLAISEAEMAGVRGPEMLAIKAELLRLKAEHAAHMGKR